MAYSEDHIALAAEYALGTLDAGERAQVETMMAVDEAFAAIVQAWSYRLGVLNQMVGSVEPRPIVWENIRSEIARTAPAQQPPALAETSPPPPPALELPASERAEPAIEAAQTPAEPPAEAGPVEQVVPQHQGTRGAADKVRPDGERLRQAVRRGLLRVREVDAELRAVTEQPLELRRVVRGRDDQDVLDARQHQRAERVVDHRLVVDRHHLLADTHRDRVQPGAASAGQDDSAHVG